MIYLTGGAGVPNYGDELIVDSWLRWYVDENGVPPSDIKVNGSWPKVFSRLFGERYPGLRYSGEMRLARMDYRPASFPEFAKIGYQFLDDPARRDSDLMRDLDRTSVFHLHGGGYLNTFWPEHAFNVGIGAWLKDHVGASVVGTGLGFGPLPDYEGAEQEDLHEIFSRFDVLEARDAWSHEYVLRNELHEAPVAGLDDAFLVPPRTKHTSGSVLHLSVFSPDVVARMIRELPEEFVESFDQVMFWICTNADATHFASFAGHYRHTQPLNIDTLLRAIPVGDTNYMVTTRFHPHLMGAWLGMSGSYESKSSNVQEKDYYDVKHGSLKSLGSRFNTTDLADLDGDASTWGDSEQILDGEAVTRKRSLLRPFVPGMPPEPQTGSRRSVVRQIVNLLPRFGRSAGSTVPTEHRRDRRRPR